MKLQDWKDVIDTNLNSVFYLTHSVLGEMLKREHGRIINISSINGQKGQFGQVNYAASKAGMHGFTKALALEVARKGITVNTISPGYVDTNMVKAVPEKIREQILSQIPVGRFALPEEVAHVVVFLSDEKSAYITGANIAINGGQYMA
jgi:acetoacetyl-CoA reductase